jgi:hypothetical protein
MARSAEDPVVLADIVRPEAGMCRNASSKSLGLAFLAYDLFARNCFCFMARPHIF